jgi:hemoglobin
LEKKEGAMSAESRPNVSDAVHPNGIEFSYRDINTVVDIFYRRIAEDPILKVPFQSVHDWPDHVDRLTNFWWMKFGGKPYLFAQYNPVGKHYFAGFNSELLKRWLGIFHEVLQSQLAPKQAELWTLISERMGHALSIKNEMYGEEVAKAKKS